MDANLQAKWVQALRSGEYKQGALFLRKDGKHCCLGVLCELAGLEITPGGMVVAGPYEVDDYEPLYDLLGGSDTARQLWNRNDGNGMRKHSFAEIADYIEANL